MFYGNSENELESGFLRSGKIFRSRKRRRNATRRGSCSETIGEEYELVSYLDRGYCNEEEEYQLISQEVEEEEKALVLALIIAP